jgi:hypothetical protein
MAGRTIPIRVGDVELAVETTSAAGTEATSALGDAAGKVVDGFGQAEVAIVALADRVAAVVEDLQRRAVSPASLQVQFGLKFSATGHVIVAGATAEAALSVTVTYDVAKTAL